MSAVNVFPVNSKIVQSRLFNLRKCCVALLNLRVNGPSPDAGTILEDSNTAQTPAPTHRLYGSWTKSEADLINQLSLDIYRSTSIL